MANDFEETLEDHSIRFYWHRFSCRYVVGAYINNIGFHNLKLMYTLSTTEKLIVPMDKVGHYLAREDRSVGLLKERLNSKGWSYVEQEGSNYFLKREMKNHLLPCSNGIINMSFIRLKGE